MNVKADIERTGWIDLQARRQEIQKTLFQSLTGKIILAGLVSILTFILILLVVSFYFCIRSHDAGLPRQGE